MPELPLESAQTQESPFQARPGREAKPGCGDEAMLCDRCGKAEMYRMHAVWRCPACGFKTDCCGW